jgi:hypothetical protein
MPSEPTITPTLTVEEEDSSKDNRKIVIVKSLGNKPNETPDWSIYGLKEALDEDVETPAWVIKDLVMPATVTLVSSRPHGTKSLSWLYACLEGVATKKVFGHFDAPDLDSVLFIETEDPEWLVKKRLQGLAKGLNVKPEDVLGFYFTCPGPFNLLPAEEPLKAIINRLGLNLIVLSTLQNLLQARDWTSQEDMQPIMAMLVRLSRHCPIVLLTHAPHDKRQKRAAGTITQGANCATLVHYEKVRAKDGKGTYVHILVDSKVGATETDFSIELLKDSEDEDPVSSIRGFKYKGEGYPGGESKKQRVIDALEDDPEASPEEIAERVECSLRYVQKIKKELEAKS